MVRSNEALIDVDPEFGILLSPDREAAARRDIRVRSHTVPVGEWDAEQLAETDPDHLGLLVVDGVLSREVLIADSVSAELVGAGDVLRPWQLRPEPGLVPMRLRWRALTGCRIAVLDRRVGEAFGRYPEINAVLVDRLGERARRLAMTQAISQLTRVDRRLLALLWHLAERWGRVGSGGVLLPMTLSHQLLSQLVGARRPTVSAALADLASRGEVTRRSDGTWLLSGERAGIEPPPGGAAALPRRRLMPVPARRSAVPPTGPAGGDREPSEHLAGMSDALARVRASSELHAGELQRHRARSHELCARAAELRRRLAARRA